MISPSSLANLNNNESIFALTQNTEFGILQIIVNACSSLRGQPANVQQQHLIAFSCCSSTNLFRIYVPFLLSLFAGERTKEKQTKQ